MLPHARFILFLAVFVPFSAMVSLAEPFAQAVVVGFDLAVLVFISTSISLWRDDYPDAARDRASRDDGGRLLLILITALTIFSILLAVGRMIEQRSTPTTVDLILIAGTLVLAWTFLNLVYAFHYAHLFYDQKDGGDKKGIIFPDDEMPVFGDFVYFSFVIGMTCQTSDLVNSSRHIRRTVTLHGVFAFFFNLGVLALAINVLAGVL